MNAPSSAVNAFSIGGVCTTMPPPPRAVETPAWNDVTGWCVVLSTTWPAMRPPGGSSMLTSFAGAVTLRISWMNASWRLAISII